MTTSDVPEKMFLTGFDVFRNDEQARIKSESETTTAFNLMKHMPFIADKWQKTSDECKEVFKTRGSMIQKLPARPQNVPVSQTRVRKKESARSAIPMQRLYFLFV